MWSTLPPATVKVLKSLRTVSIIKQRILSTGNSRARLICKHDRCTMLKAMAPLFIRNFIFTVLQPGIVAGLIPWWITGDSWRLPFHSPLQFIHYLAIVVFLLGLLIMLECIKLFFRTPDLWIYSAGIFSAFHLFIIFGEEPRLKRTFGDAYTTYCKKVGRWI